MGFSLVNFHNSLVVLFLFYLIRHIFPWEMLAQIFTLYAYVVYSYILAELFRQYDWGKSVYPK